MSSINDLQTIKIQQKKSFFWFQEKRTSKINVPAGVVIRRWVFIVLWEAVKITCVNC